MQTGTPGLPWAGGGPPLADLVTPYMLPQENENRHGTRWLKLVGLQLYMPIPYLLTITSMVRSSLGGSPARKALNFSRI